MLESHMQVGRLHGGREWPIQLSPTLNLCAIHPPTTCFSEVRRIPRREASYRASFQSAKLESPCGQVTRVCAASGRTSKGQQSHIHSECFVGCRIQPMETVERKSSQNLGSSDLRSAMVRCLRRTSKLTKSTMRHCIT